MVFDRSKKAGQNQPNPIARPNPTARSEQATSEKSGKKVIHVGGNGGGERGGNGGGRGNGQTPPPETSPWLLLEGEEPPIDRAAGFVEYLRWMRSPDSQYKDPTKVQILQTAVENADYCKRLTVLNHRTKLIAGDGNWFEVAAAWRIRVGGHKGPESILLPAFDALGMPYIPGSTLRGVARNQAIRELMAKDSQLKWKDAEKQVEPYFGGLNAAAIDRAGKVVFLDAYPISSSTGGLAMDMANAIWNWDGDDLKYAPNPNPFLSIDKTSFILGLRKTVACTDEVLAKVRQWLEAGLAEGIGSQVNTGYGRLMSDKAERSSGFLEVDFTIEGQLIHGHQAFTQWTFNDRRQEWQMRGSPQAEVRPTAFKSMLCYWFRAFVLGVLPVNVVKDLEAKIFGSITPQTLGWVTVEVLDGRVVQREPKPNYQGRDEPNGKQTGTLVLNYSQEIPSDQKTTVSELLISLTWLMFHLGGVGQGARRPLYSRKNRPTAPWWRGCNLIAESEDVFWDLPDDVSEFKRLFQQRLHDFYQALGKVSQTKVDPKILQAVGIVTPNSWSEVVDRHCQIVVCSGKENFEKPYALAVLHSDDLKKPKQGKNGDELIYNPDLCGVTQGNRVKPSPVWIANLGDYQVVTMFGSSQNPRRQYLEELRNRTSSQNFAQIFPLPQ